MTRIYRASELGGCTKSQVAKQLGYLGMDPPAFMQKVFDEGHKAEITAKRLLRETGHPITDEQQEVELVVTKDVIVQGHVDGRIETLFDDPPLVVEIKSMSRIEFDKWINAGWNTLGLVQKYKWQVSAYMNATRARLFFAVICREETEDGEWDLDISIVDEPFHTEEDIKKRVLLMEALVRQDKLPDVCSLDMGWVCPVRYLHGELDYELSDDQETADIAMAYKGALSKKRVAEDEAKLLREKLDKLTEKKSFHHPDVEVTYYEAKNPPRWDEERLREKLGEDLSAYKSQTKGTRCRVTIREKEAGDEPGGD